MSEKRVDPQHRMKCNRCGEFFHMGELDQVLAHEHCDRRSPQSEDHYTSQLSEGDNKGEDVEALVERAQHLLSAVIHRGAADTYDRDRVTEAFGDLTKALAALRSAPPTERSEP